MRTFSHRLQKAHDSVGDSLSEAIQEEVDMLNTLNYSEKLEETLQELLLTEAFQFKS